MAIFTFFPLLRVQFKGGYYSPNQLIGAGSIQGRVLIEKIRYVGSRNILNIKKIFRYIQCPFYFPMLYNWEFQKELFLPLKCNVIIYSILGSLRSNLYLLLESWGLSVLYRTFALRRTERRLTLIKTLLEQVSGW